MSDTNQASPEGIRNGFRLEARLKKERASVSNPILVQVNSSKSKSTGGNSESDDVSYTSLRTAQNGLKLDEHATDGKLPPQGFMSRPEVAGERMVSNMADVSAVDSVDSDLRKYASSKYSGSRRDSVRQDLAGLGSSQSLGDRSMNDSQNSASTFSQRRPSEAKMKPESRVTRPGAQHIQGGIITHAMAMENIAALGKQDPTKQWTMETDVSPVTPGRSRGGASYDEETKDEIAELHDAHTAAGVALVRNSNDGLATDGIALHERQLSTETSRTSARRGDGNVDIEEGSHTCGPRDFGGGSNVVVSLGAQDSSARFGSGLVQATLVDDDPGIIVTAVTGTCGSAPAARDLTRCLSLFVPPFFRCS
jgi:hypothetical protein